MRQIITASAIVFLTQIGIASAGGPFDGNWSGEAHGTTGPMQQCIATATATVQENVLRGELKWGRFKPSVLGGKVAPDGTFSSSGGGITGKFEGNSFTGSFSVPSGYCNPYKLTMNRS
jgi:hypothetical protein